MATAGSSSGSSALSYPAPTRGASLVLAFRPQRTLILGSNKLAATRTFAALEADSRVTILAKGGVENACEELRWRACRGEIEIVDLDTFSSSGDGNAAVAFESYLETQPVKDIKLLFVTDTLIRNGHSQSRRSLRSARTIYETAHRHSISVNTADMSELCDFTVCASHRFMDPTSSRSGPSALQVGVTTNGRGCRLGARIRREIVARLPREVGSAAASVGELRELAKSRDRIRASAMAEEGPGEEEVDDETEPSPNRPAELLTRSESEAESTRRRMRWVAQVSEYWSFSKLAALSQTEMLALLDSAISAPSSATELSSHFSQHGLNIIPPKRQAKEGRVLLVGSGPGHPSLLSLAAHAALTSHADLVLTDKLVPQPILALIPPSTPTIIARKFPGNADRAQEELMQLALKGAQEGKTVVRLKQGDPALYGRVGEEVLFLRKHGVRTLVIPGISSALAAPLLAGIPVTQRGAADSLVVCTGVGRGGKSGSAAPPYKRARTVVLLMGNARLASVIESLLEEVGYPPWLPAAIVERASMPDQRVLTTRLDSIVEALDSLGEQRPPGLLVVGWAVFSLSGEGNLDVLGDEGDGAKESLEEKEKQLAAKDEERVNRWIGDQRWMVVEGADLLWEMFDDLGSLQAKTDTLNVNGAA